MATLQFMIEAGKVVDYCGRYFESISEDGLKAVGNGWEVTIRPASKKRPGRIIAHCEREYSDGPAVCHREFKLQDGTLGLAGGNVYSRYAYFRTADFQKFLDEFGITAVKREDPNQAFTSFCAYSGRGSANQTVETDGKVEWHYEDEPGSCEYFEAPGANPNLYKGKETHEVSGATWAIVETKEDYGDNHNYAKILYTLVKDVSSIAPELRQRKERERKIERIDRILARNREKFETMAQLRAFVEELIGGSFPATAAETPGEATLKISYRWDSFLYNGISFQINDPCHDPKGKAFNGLDEIGAYIKYSVVRIGDSLRLSANDTRIAEIQL